MKIILAFLLGAVALNLFCVKNTSPITVKKKLKRAIAVGIPSGEIVIFGESKFRRMNIQTEKLDIIQWLAKVNDSNIIRQFMLLKKSNEETASVNLTPAERKQ